MRARIIAVKPVMVVMRHREFNNKLLNDLCDELKIAVAMTSAYHPQTNGYLIHAAYYSY